MSWELLLWIVPAYVANSTATLSKFFPKRHPVDFGYVCRDGRRLLGNGKTWEGLLMGTTLGTLAGWPFFWYFHIPYNAFLVAFGALLGDMVGSFAKRRIGLDRGAEAPVIDQLDFMFGAFALGGPLPAEYSALFLLITPIIHRTANIIGYLIGVKNEPW